MGQLGADHPRNGTLGALTGIVLPHQQVCATRDLAFRVEMRQFTMQDSTSRRPRALHLATSATVDFSPSRPSARRPACRAKQDATGILKMLVPSEEEVSGRAARAAPARVRASVWAAAVDGLLTGLASSCPDQRLVSLSRVVIVGSRGE